jgi:hypothetical protein
MVSYLPFRRPVKNPIGIVVELRIPHPFHLHPERASQSLLVWPIGNQLQ